MYVKNSTITQMLPLHIYSECFSKKLKSTAAKLYLNVQKRAHW